MDFIKSDYSLVALFLGAVAYILFSDVIKHAVSEYSIEAKVFMMLFVSLLFAVAFASIDSGGRS